MSNKLMVVDSEQFETTQRVAKAMVASGYFKDAADVAKAIVKIMAGQEMGLGAFASMTGINIQGGKPVLGGNLIATLIKQHPHYDYKVKKLTNQECILVFFENGESAGESSFSIQDAKTARVWSKKKSGFIPLTEHNQNWQSYPRNMLFARAISNGAKWFVPGIFGGAPVYTPEELGVDVDSEGETIDVTPEREQPITGSPEWVEKVAVIQPDEITLYKDPMESEDEPAPKSNGNGGKYSTRPYTPETLRDAMQHKTKDDDGTLGSPKDRQWAAASIGAITLDDVERYDVTEYLFGIRSTKELTEVQANAINDWVEYKKVGDDWVFSDDARQEAADIVKQVAKDRGQLEMELEAK